MPATRVDNLTLKLLPAATDTDAAQARWLCERPRVANHRQAIAGWRRRLTLASRRASNCVTLSGSFRRLECRWHRPCSYRRMQTSLDSYLGIHAQALTLEAKRNELLAANLANVDTPNYKARDLDFKAAMRRPPARPPRRVHRPAHPPWRFVPVTHRRRPRAWSVPRAAATPL